MTLTVSPRDDVITMGVNRHPRIRVTVGSREQGRYRALRSAPPTRPERDHTDDHDRNREDRDSWDVHGCVAISSLAVGTT